MKDQLRPALTMLVVLTVLTGLMYPLAVTGLAQLFFPHQANGSLVVRDGKVIGSELIGQYFDQPKYFWSRPSATLPFPSNAAASSGSNLGPSNPGVDRNGQRESCCLASSGSRQRPAHSCGSRDCLGKRADPHISLAAAAYQVGRVARARVWRKGRWNG
jgi:K+-transporting ATPase ATPase C chain